MSIVDQLKLYIPKLLTQKRIVILFFALVLLFCIFFVVVYRPIGLLQPQGILSSLDYRLYSIILVLLGLVVFSVSRRSLYLVQRRIKMSLGAYFIWIGCEFFVLVVLLTVAAWYLNENPYVSWLELAGRVIIDIVALLTMPYIAILVSRKVQARL